jgi:hypothetical protein
MIGTVAYIDLLGFSSLTQHIQEKKYKKIINRYINGLHKIIKNAIRNSSIKFNVISDSVFLYIENQCDDLLFALSRIFRDCIIAGILLRCGVSYGEYNIVKTILSDDNIFGEAVTNAVNNEKKGKGCRIFIDTNIPNKGSAFEFNKAVFQEYRNYVEYSYVDVFEWPLILDRYYFKPTMDYDTKSEPTVELLKLIFENYKLSIYLRFSPFFSWNVKESAGLLHIAVSIEYITTIIDKLLEKTKNYETELITVDGYIKDIHRSKLIVSSMIERGKNIFLRIHEKETTK